MNEYDLEYLDQIVQVFSEHSANHAATGTCLFLISFIALHSLVAKLPMQIL